MPLTPIVHIGASHRCTLCTAQWRKATNASHIVHSGEREHFSHRLCTVQPLTLCTVEKSNCAASYIVHWCTVEKGNTFHTDCAQWNLSQVHSGEKQRTLLTMCTVEKRNTSRTDCAQWRKTTNASHTKKKLLPNSATNGQCSKTALYSIYHMEPIFHWFCANSRVLSYL